MKLTIPIRTYSEANLKQHWAVKAKRVKAQREAVAWASAGEWKYSFMAIAADITLAHNSYRVILTRIAPRELDGDNLQRSFKAVRDEVAKQLGVDDRDKRVTWQYSQRKGRPKDYSVEIEILPAKNSLGWMTRTKPLTRSGQEST